MNRDLSDEFAFRLGVAIADRLQDDNLRSAAVCHDCRPSSPGYAGALAEGLSTRGIHVTMLGQGPTPLLYFAITRPGIDAGIQITGSHNPSHMNGFKIGTKKRSLHSEAIQDLYSRMQRGLTEPLPNPRPGLVRPGDLSEAYLENAVHYLRGRFGSRRLRIVVDAGNGVGGTLGPELLERLGIEVIRMFCEPDGSFPNHHPDPTVPKYMEQLAERVVAVGADFGIGYDGDADRMAVVDEAGTFILPDRLIYLFGKEIVEEIPGAAIVGDAKVSTLVYRALDRLGAQTVMWKTGPPLIKEKIKQENALLGAEFAAHYVFRHRYDGFDDGIYAAARFAALVSRTQKPVSALLHGFPKACATPEIFVPCDDEIKFQVCDLLAKEFKDLKPITIDGIRLEFPDGWALVRPSNTQPVLTLRFEASNEARLAEYRDLVERKLAATLNGFASASVQNG